LYLDLIKTVVGIFFTRKIVVGIEQKGAPGRRGTTRKDPFSGSGVLLIWRPTNLMKTQMLC
jgi:hypothetical protein